MTFLATYLSMMVGAICTVIALTAMRRREKHNIGKIGWLCLILLTPPVGLVLFILFGGKRVSAEHSQRKQIDLPECPSGQDVGGVLAEIAERRGLSPPSSCNQFEWFTEPQTMKAALIKLIESTRSRVLIHSFILADDDLSSEIFDILVKKARSGVEVRLMIDGFGSFFFPQQRLKQLEDAGGRTTRFKPPSRLSRFAYSSFRNHRKLICVDGCRAIIGGANFVQYEVTDHPDDETWIDYFAHVEGIAARQLEAVFVSDWNFATGEKLAITKVVDEESNPDTSLLLSGQNQSDRPETRTALQVIPIGPDGPDQILVDIWMTAINRAESRVWILTPYFVPPPIAMGTLMMAARRGIDVRIMFPSESDVSPADSARHDYTDELSQAGASILLYPNRMVHAKILIIDDDTAFVGSANFDMRSFFLNYELVMGVFDESRVTEMADWFVKLSEECSEGPKKPTWQRRSLRVLTRIFAEEL